MIETYASIITPVADIQKQIIISIIMSPASTSTMPSFDHLPSTVCRTPGGICNIAASPYDSRFRYQSKQQLEICYGSQPPSIEHGSLIPFQIVCRAAAQKPLATTWPVPVHIVFKGGSMNKVAKFRVIYQHWKRTASMVNQHI